jgi:lipopolysaccharide/colanic/teichoic acid biosynthesis glycosyltransferase
MFNRIIALLIFVLAFPVILFASLIIFFQDFKSPIYLQKRVGFNGNYFILYKIRTMRINHNSPVFLATSMNDERLFKIGKLFRKFKVDELPQFLNVLIGDLNIIGPRPNIIPLLNNYSYEEFQLLKIKPGLTDIASVMLSDLNEKLKDSKNPDLDYENIYRKKKNSYGLYYIKNNSVGLNFFIFIATIIVIINKNAGKKYLESKINL